MSLSLTDKYESVHEFDCPKNRGVGEAGKNFLHEFSGKVNWC